MTRRIVTFRDASFGRTADEDLARDPDLRRRGFGK